jgi:hypothetical protein
MASFKYKETRTLKENIESDIFGEQHYQIFESLNFIKLPYIKKIKEYKTWCQV